MLKITPKLGLRQETFAENIDKFTGRFFFSSFTVVCSKQNSLWLSEGASLVRLRSVCINGTKTMSTSCTNQVEDKMR